MKNFLKQLLPIRLHTPAKSFIRKFFLISYLWSDIKHLIHKRGYYKKESKFLKTRARIIKYYHRLEKSLATPNFTKGRGVRAAIDLIGELKVYKSQKFDLNDNQVIVALDVLKKFIAKQESQVQENLQRQINELGINHNSDIEGGTLLLDKDYFTKNTDSNFELLSLSRHSVRDYDHKDVDVNLIRKAVEIAQKSPSVCNRQGWHTILVTNSEVINLFREIHNGFARSDQYLSSLLIICFTKSSFDYPLERHQGYTDGGLFSMSIMYALTYLGLASCPLNANLSKKAEKKLRSAINLSNEYGLVMFIAVGHYADETTVPVSHRDSHQKKIHHIK